MYLKLDNNKQIKKFYRLLSLYKSIIFKFVKFKTSNSDKNINLIIEALNIKNRKERITFVYDEACKLIDNQVNGKNICGFENCKCYTQRNNSYKYGCFRMCRYKTNSGCSTKNLACKLFNCSEVKKRYKVIEYDDLKILKLLSIRQRFIVKSDYFTLRENVLKDLYSYSFIYSSIKIILRTIIDFIHVKAIEKRTINGGIYGN